MLNRISYICYRVIKFCVRLVFPRMTVEGAENLPKEPCIVVGNHSQMNGPIACELYSPRKRYTWCIGEMMHMKEVPAYSFQDFWSEKPKSVRWLFRIASYLIAPLAVCVFNQADTIGVYKDIRVAGTFKETVGRLCEGADVVIFPEHGVPCNPILYDFQDRFVDVARLYYRKTGQEISFVPLYIAPRLHRMIYARPIQFRASAPIAQERERICTYLKEEITRTATALPPHIVVPYKNIPKRDYPKNTDCLKDNTERGIHDSKTD